MSRFVYLPVAIVYASGLYVVLLIISICLYKKYGKHSADSSFFESFFKGREFSVVYQSCLPEGRWQYILLGFRIVACLYFFGVGMVYLYAHDNGGSAHYFTIWNIDLITLYYFLASVASTIGIMYDKPSDETRVLTISHYPTWSDNMTTFGYTVQILFELAGGTAFFITVVAFTTLDPYFHFWNVVIHFTTTMTFLIEITLNKMTVRWEHYIINISWALLYLFFIWPIVACGVLSDWPYFFLASDTPAVFVWYAILFLVDIFFFALFWTVVWGKYKLLEYFHIVIYESDMPEQRDFLIGGNSDI
jgi:hypothetical protein